jgi:hypothetical protein
MPGTAFNYCLAAPYAWNGRRRVVHGIRMFSFAPSVMAIAKLVGALQKIDW